MDEKELLKKAFEYRNVPSNITYCFTEPCPMKNKCIHYLSGLYKNEKTDRGDAIFPNALKNGNCKYFAPLRVVKMAWGFDKLFAEMKVKDAPALRAEMRDYLGSKGTAVDYALKQFQLEKEDAYVFGDSSNDLTMFRCGAHTIALGKHDEVLDPYTEYVTDTVERDGVAKAMEHYGLI